MPEPRFLSTPSGRRIAFCQSPGRAPGIVFLHGLRSDMEGTKALHLEARAQAAGRAFLRLDMSGHGRSSGRFEEGAIGDWLADAREVIAACTEGPQVLVGSSMGGWIALLLAREAPGRVAGLVGVAAAPDFTARMREGLSAAERAALAQAGRIERPSAHDGGPYVFTRRLFDDGDDHLVLRAPLRLPFPVRLLQGEADADVPSGVALGLFAHAEGADIRLTLVKGADHRFSSPACLALLADTVEEVAAAAAR